MATPPLGHIEPANRTAMQQAAHAIAAGKAKQFSLPPITLAKGEAIRLFDFWKHPDVVADVGFVFDRIHQQTGSCVWAGGTNALFTTICAQRLASDKPTKAFLPFTLHNYASSRHRFGDDGRGEGSMGSTFFASLDEDGVRAWPNDGSDGLPKYTDRDGIEITSREELDWSSWHNAAVKQIIQTTGANSIASTGECKSVADIRSMIGNGYGVSFACNNYIGHASVEGSGADARVIGYWDGSGGHQQSIHAVEEHPKFGPIYWAQNNWPGSTYPRDPGGGPICGCWVREAKVEAAMRLDAEVYGLSSLDWFPAQPAILTWVIAP